MAQSTLTISTTEYDLHIMNYSEKFEPILGKYTTVADPADYGADNSVLVANGVAKHVFTVQGWCTIAERAIYIAALKATIKVYPIVYPNSGDTNVIETSAWYYIQSFGGDFENGTLKYWFSMSLVYGGA